MKYPLFVLLFCLACATAKKSHGPYDGDYNEIYTADSLSFRHGVSITTGTLANTRSMQPYEPTRLARFDDGTFADYHAISQDSTAYPKLTRIGQGRIYAIGGVMQFDTNRYYFFDRKTTDQ